MVKVKEDWSVSPDLCCPLSLDQDQLDCELALLKWRTTEELQDNLILCYLRMPWEGYSESQASLVKIWRQRLIDELVSRKPIHWRPWLGARLAQQKPKPPLAEILAETSERSSTAASK